MAITTNPLGVAQQVSAPGDVAKRRLDRRQLRRAGPRHGVCAVIVDTDGLQLERIGNMSRNRARHRRAAFGEQECTAERVQTLQIALPPSGVDFPLSRPARELTGDDRRHQERDECHPVLRVGDREGSHRGQKEEVETQHRPRSTRWSLRRCPTTSRPEESRSDTRARPSSD